MRACDIHCLCFFISLNQLTFRFDIYSNNALLKETYGIAIATATINATMARYRDCVRDCLCDCDCCCLFVYFCHYTFSRIHIKMPCSLLSFALTPHTSQLMIILKCTNECYGIAPTTSPNQTKTHISYI